MTLDRKKEDARKAHPTMPRAPSITSSRILGDSDSETELSRVRPDAETERSITLGDALRRGRSPERRGSEGPATDSGAWRGGGWGAASGPRGGSPGTANRVDDRGFVREPSMAASGLVWPLATGTASRPLRMVRQRPGSRSALRSRSVTLRCGRFGDG